MGAALAWGGAFGRPSKSGWRERRELYPQGVASGDPDDNSVLLWTRRPYADGRKSAKLLVEVAEDSEFTRVIATTTAQVSAASDWTCRVLVGHLPPAGEYWYRFVDEKSNGSRIGRTLTAPGRDDARPSRFAFVSCQSLPEGAMNAYRRMIWEDERAAPEEMVIFPAASEAYLDGQDPSKKTRGDPMLGFPAASVEDGAVLLAVTCTPSRISGGAATDDEVLWAGPRSRDARNATPATATMMTVATTAATAHVDRPPDPGVDAVLGAGLGAAASGTFAGGESVPASARSRSCVNSRQDA